jgi:hypothetical protein
MPSIRESALVFLHCHHLDVVCSDEAFSCVIGTPHPDSAISAWSFYFSEMLFDFLALSISTYYLLKVQATAASA